MYLFFRARNSGGRHARQQAPAAPQHAPAAPAPCLPADHGPGGGARLSMQAIPLADLSDREKLDLIGGAAQAYDYENRPRDRNWSAVPLEQVGRLLAGALMSMEFEHPATSPAAGNAEVAYEQWIEHRNPGDLGSMAGFVAGWQAAITAASGWPLCPNGCGCRLGSQDADSRDCACDGLCCYGEIEVSEVFAERDRLRKLLAETGRDSLTDSGGERM